jgi:dihydrofolate synthase / folylpolyglutamate synthase
VRPATRTFEDVCQELDRRRRVALGFERIEALLDLLDHPEHDLRIAQVVGTNGKGTTAVALAAALEEAGHRSGAYLSPHVLSYAERVVIHGHPVSEEEFANAMGEVIAIADEHSVPATQFELLTAGALEMFRDAGLSWAVMEAGLGARHDATSAAQPEAVVLTNVALDHTQYLGGTIEEIACEKLASVRRGAVLVLGSDDPRVEEIARREVGRVGARLARVGNVGEEEISALGFVPYAARDVGLGFAAAEVLLDRALSHGERGKAARRVMGALPARFEERAVRGVPVVIDGGHNPEALKATLGAVRARYEGRPLAVVFGVLEDKDAGSMLDLLKKRADALVLTRPVGAGERPAEPADLVREHDPTDARGERARVMEQPVGALLAAVEEMEGADGVVLVTGSFHTAAGVLGWLRGGGR